MKGYRALFAVCGCLMLGVAVYLAFDVLIALGLAWIGVQCIDEATDPKGRP